MRKRTVARVVVQLLLIAPMLLMFPFALALSYMAVVILFMSVPGGVNLLVTVCQIFASVGLTVLVISVLLTTAALRRRPWRGLVTAGLVMGLVSTVVWLGLLAAEPDGHAPPVFSIQMLYLFGGAVVVAHWNLWRAWGKDGALEKRAEEALPENA